VCNDYYSKWESPSNTILLLITILLMISYNVVFYSIQVILQYYYYNVMCQCINAIQYINAIQCNTIMSIQMCQY